MNDKDQQARDIVKRYALYAGAAGLIRVPLADIAAVTLIELKMIRELAGVYGVEYSDDRVRPMIAALLGAYLGTRLGFAAGGLLSRTLPVVGSTLGMLALPGMTAGFTWSVGKIFIMHFASGGTFLNFDPSQHRAPATAPA